MKIISFQGQQWRLHKATSRWLIFHPMDGAGKAIADWRKKNKLNQRLAAERLGISQPHLARIEKGIRICPPELFAKIHQL